VGLLQELEPALYPDLHHAKLLDNKIMAETTPNAKLLHNKLTTALHSEITPVPSMHAMKNHMPSMHAMKNHMLLPWMQAAVHEIVANLCVP